MSRRGDVRTIHDAPLRFKKETTRSEAKSVKVESYLWGPLVSLAQASLWSPPGSSAFPLSTVLPLMLRRLVLLPLLAGIVRACPGDEVPFPDEECVSYDAAAADADSGVV